MEKQPLWIILANDDYDEPSPAEGGASLLLTRPLIHVNDVVDKIHDYKTEMRRDSEEEREREKTGEERELVANKVANRSFARISFSQQPFLPVSVFLLPSCSETRSSGADPLKMKYSLVNFRAARKASWGKTREIQGHMEGEGGERERERAWRASREHACPSVPHQTRESVSAFSRQFFTREHAPVSDSRPPSLTTHRLRRNVRDLSSSMIENHRRRTMSTAELNLEIPSYSKINTYIATNFLTNT